MKGSSKSEGFEGNGLAHTSVDVPELLSMATRRIYGDNPFGILGVSVGASARDIARRIDHIKMEAELNHSTHSDGTPCAWNGKKPLTEEAIKEAGKLLRSPLHRFLCELLWVWPASYPQAAPDHVVKSFREMTPTGRVEAVAQWEKDLVAGEEVHDDLEQEKKKIIAKHNLAVYAHISALDTVGTFGPVVNESANRRDLAEINATWTNVTQLWSDVFEDEDLWTLVAKRAAALDDPQITSGLLRRVRSTLPYAFALLNARCALEVAGSGGLKEAIVHVETIDSWGLTVTMKEHLLGYVTQAERARIASYTETAKRRAEADVETGVEQARALIADSDEDFYKVSLVYGNEHEAVLEMKDDVANVCIAASIAYQRKTGDDEALLKLLVLLERNLQPSARIVERLKDLKKRAKANLDYEREIKPVADLLDELSPSLVIDERFRILETEISPLIDQLRKKKELQGLDRLLDLLAREFRGISIRAHNEFRNMKLAIAAIKRAQIYAADSELISLLTADAAQLEKNIQDRDSHNVNIKIRGTEVEIDHARFRCDHVELRAQEVTGVRWGVFVQTTNGISSHYYTIWAETPQKNVEIECKRIFRSVDEAKRDFQTIVGSIYYHIAPGLVDRVVNALLGSGSYPVGSLLKACDKTGILLSKGALFWKEEVRVPFEDLALGCAQGYLYVQSAKKPEFKTAFSLRECWNAVIFEEIVAALIKRRKKSDQ